jgi:molybdate transport system substrate-binding protein
MRKNCVAVLLVVLSLGLSQPANAEEILVSAAASLTDVLKEIGKVYQSKTKNRTTFNFGASNDLARQIDEGAPADIFFSADLVQMDHLDQKGRIESATRKTLLSNQLVIVLPFDSKLALRSTKDLLQPEVKRIALAEPSTVPVGVYSKKYLESEGLWDGIKEKIVPVLNVRATLASVESGNVEAGFVYKTDAAISKKVRIAYEVPIEKGPKITYPVAVVKESKKKGAAREFVNFLATPEAKGLFEKYGFVVLR